MGFRSPACASAFLEVFDDIWIDCLNGDKYKTGKLAREGDPDYQHVAVDRARTGEGIQVGASIALLARSGSCLWASHSIRFTNRHLGEMADSPG